MQEAQSVKFENLFQIMRPIVPWAKVILRKCLSVMEGKLDWYVQTCENVSINFMTHIYLFIFRWDWWNGNGYENLCILENLRSFILFFYKS